MKQIKINRSLGVYLDKTPFPLGDLIIEITGLPNIIAEWRFIGKINGKEIVKENIDGEKNVVKIESKKLAAGVFSACVVQYNGGVETAIYKIENLIIKDIEGDLWGQPEIAQLKSKCEELEKSLALEQEKRKALDEKINIALNYSKDIIIGLLNFAFEDYIKNIYLNGCENLDEFLQKYNISLNEIDKFKIKGE